MRIHRFAIVVLVLLLTFSGCIGDERGKGPFKLLKWKLMRDGADHYLGVASKGKTPISGFLGVDVDLWPPFRWEVTLGLFADTLPDDVAPGTIGTELDAAGTFPLEFYGISAQPTGGGLNVFAASHQSAPNTHGTIFFPGARKVDVAIEHDGANVRFYAREHAVGNYQQIASIDPGAASWPVFPAVGTAGIAKPAAVGFDLFGVAINSGPAGPVTPEYAAILSIWQAVNDQVAAMHASDGAAPDVAAALAAAESGAITLDLAIAAIGLTLPKAKQAQGALGALKLLEKARKGLGKVIGKLEQGKAGKSAIKGLMKAVQYQLLAVEALRD